MRPDEIEAQAVDPAGEYARTHIEQYLASDGADVEHPLADQLILLYTRGRRSGDIRRVPLASFPDGDDLLVIGSKGGAPDNPDWYHNLVADPAVWVRRKDRIYEAQATVLDGDERRVRWERIIADHPGFARYQEKSGRTLPLVRLRER